MISVVASWPALALSCGRRWVPALCCVVMTLGARGAEDGRPPEQRYAYQLGQARRALDSRTTELKWFAGELEHLGDFAKADLALLQNEFAGILAAWQNVIDAYLRGDGENAKILERAAEKRQSIPHWHAHLDARRRQSELWPGDEWVQQIQAKWRGPNARRWAPSFIDARRRASTAWARVADAQLPDADPKRLIELEDLAWTAEFNSRAAEAVYNSNEDKDRVMRNTKVTSEELSRKIAEIDALDKERITLAREQAETDRRRREWERRRKAVQKDLVELYDTTARAWEETQRKNRK